jgi:hypothetical protein
MRGDDFAVAGDEIGRGGHLAAFFMRFRKELSEIEEKPSPLLHPGAEPAIESAVAAGDPVGLARMGA